jgi:hypothetical protein
MCGTSKFTSTEPKNQEELNSEHSIIRHVKNIPKNRLLPGLAAIFSRDRTPVDSNHNVTVLLPVLDAKSTKASKPFIQERLRHGIWLQFLVSFFLHDFFLFMKHS